MTTQAATQTSQSPALWNPNAAACWSLVFSPAFGAFLHARNANALGRPNEAKANRVWFYISIVYLIVAIASTFFPRIPDQPFTLATAVLLLSWYFSLGKKQINYVKQTFRDDYERKSWTKALLIAFGCLICTFVLLFIVGLVEELIFGSQ